MKTTRSVVLVAAIVLFLAWIVAHMRRIIGGSDDVIRIVLGFLFALLILLRWKPWNRNATQELPGWISVVMGSVGAFLAVAGIIFTVNQIEWLGIIFLLCACLFWALPRKYAGDAAIGMFLLYWIHPLPTQVFGTFQLLMQTLSVKGAEWLLHCMNVRVWSDAFTLYTGVRVFGVPEACSGMRTAVTVLLCTLGVCALFRFRWYETVLFAFVGLIHVLILNIVRIAFMVIWSLRMPVAWGESFLHDTVGIFLLASILIVQLEASWWKIYWDRRRKKIQDIEEGRSEPNDEATILPRIWRLAFLWGWVVIIALFVAAGLAGAVYKRRPSHRAAMIAGVVDNLAKNDQAAAERAVKEALRLTPNDQSLKSAYFRILAHRG
ncbi:MAG: exosortase/archaeosortase family protein, partial [Lentisphaerae bacterium]|nr:exosortase/archaeosortase family protein [Lentisphaerota bacterium]